MRSFTFAILVAALIGVVGAVILDNFVQKSAANAFSTSAVRL